MGTNVVPGASVLTTGSRLVAGTNIVWGTSGWGVVLGLGRGRRAFFVVEAKDASGVIGPKSAGLV